MVESSEMAWGLVILFMPAAVHGLVLCAQAWSSPLDRLRPDDKPIAFSELAMSLAMIAMVHMWGGSSAYDVQLIVFIALGGYFLLRATGFLAVGDTDRRLLGYHALMAGSMVWMFAAMTDMTGHRWVEGPGGHEGHGSSGAAGDAASVDDPLWMVMVTVAFAAALAAVWAATVRRSTPARVLATAGAREGGTTAAASGSDDAVPSPVDRMSGGCHALMTAGMIVMLLVMI